MNRNRAIGQQVGQRERRLAHFLSSMSLAAAVLPLTLGDSTAIRCNEPQVCRVGGASAVLVARETERCRSGDRESVEVGGVDGVCEVGFLRHGQKV